MAARAPLVALTLIAFTFAGCSSDPKPAAHDEIAIHGNTYDPTTLTVPRGTEIHIQNHDSVVHTVTADAGSGTFNSGDIQPGTDGHIVAPSTAGTYAYHCTRHASMHGTLKVT